MASPLSKLKPVQSGVETNQSISYFGPASSPLTKVEKPSVSMPTTLVKDDDIEKLGGDISRSVAQTSEKIVAKMSVANFEELGSILVDVQNQASKLDPNSIQKKGILGWWQRAFGDIKKELTVRLRNADAVFDQLEQKLSTHINVNTEWIKDLEQLYNENYNRYQAIVKVLETAEEWKVNLQNQIDNWPEVSPDDPDANMKIQAKRDAMSRLNRLNIKIDMFIRLKTWTESNAPKIRTQQETSRTTIQTLKDVIDQTIPMIKMEFSLFIQSLDVQKSIQLVDSTKELANTSLVKSADTAKQSAINAANSLNNPMITTNTLNHIRTRMLETFSEVDNIHKLANQTRESDRVLIEQSQKQYLEALQNNKKV